MNRLLSLTIPEFKKSIENLRQNDINALYQLIEREYQLEQDESHRLSKIMLRSSLDEFEINRVHRAIHDSENRLTNLQKMMQVCTDTTNNTDSNRSSPQHVSMPKSSAPKFVKPPVVTESLTQENFKYNNFVSEPPASMTSLKDCASSYNSSNSDCRNSVSSFSSNSLDLSSNSWQHGDNGVNNCNHSDDSLRRSVSPNQLSGLTMNRIKTQSIVKEKPTNDHNTQTDGPQMKESESVPKPEVSVVDRRMNRGDVKQLNMKTIKQSNDSVSNGRSAPLIKSKNVPCRNSTSNSLIEDASIDARSAIAVFEQLTSASRADKLQEDLMRQKLSGRRRSGQAFRMESPRFSSVEVTTSKFSPRSNLCNNELTKLSKSISDLRTGDELTAPPEALSEQTSTTQTEIAATASNFFQERKLSTAAGEDDMTKKQPVVKKEVSLKDSPKVPITVTTTADKEAIDDTKDTLVTTRTVVSDKAAKPIVVQDDTVVLNAPTLMSWNPVSLLNRLYEIGEQQPVSNNHESTNNPQQTPLSMEGFMEQLPFQMTTISSLKTWKRKLFRAEGGHLKVLNSEDRSVIEDFNISGADIEQLDDNVIGIDTKRSNYITLRCSTTDDHTKWLNVLTANSSERNLMNDWKLPDPVSSNLSDKKVLIIDFGSTSIRAGLLRETPCLPELYFPNVVAVSMSSCEACAVGIKAFDPQFRTHSKLVSPLRPEGTLDINTFENGAVKAIFMKIFQDLEIDHKEYTIFLSVPPNVSDSIRVLLADLLLKDMECNALSICGQSLLALHAYGEPTGVLVNISNRTEILPITEGVVQVGGISRLMFGGHLILQAFNQLLAEQKYRFTSATETLLTRYIMEKLGFVAQERARDYAPIMENIDLTEFGVTHPNFKNLSIYGDFSQCTEGLFDPELFNLDCPSLAKTIQKSVQACPMDFRKNLYRSIFLAGAGSLFPGLPTRLENELKRLVPSSCIIRVHAAANRKHLSYLGASYVAHSPGFTNTCVKQSEWLSRGADRSKQWALGRWHI